MYIHSANTIPHEESSHHLIVAADFLKLGRKRLHLFSRHFSTCSLSAS